MSSTASWATESSVLQKSDKESIESRYDEISQTTDEDAVKVDLNLRNHKRVVLKIDCVILPFLVITNFLCQLDKNCLSYAALYGLKIDTQLMGQDYSWLITIFYIGYLVAQIPAFILIPKTPNLIRLMSILLFLWGGTLMCMAACTNFKGLMVVRFILGVFEAAFQPTCLIISSIWYTKTEQPMRLALWSNTLAGIFNGIFGYGIGHWSGSLAVWQYIFLLYGSVSMVWAILCFFIIPGKIQNAWFLNKEEKEYAIARTATNQTGISFGNDTFKWNQIKESLLDPKYWLLVAFIIAQNFINAGVSNFNTLIIKGFGYSNYKTMLLATPQAAIAMGASVFCAIFIYFVKNIRFLMIFITTGVTITGTIMVWKIDPHDNIRAALAGVYLLGFYNAPYVMCLSLISSNTSGQTKKTFNCVSVGFFYALGNTIGPQFFFNKEAPQYITGIFALLISGSIMSCAIISYAILCFWENRKRDIKKSKELEAINNLQTQVEIGEMVDKLDLTDYENQHFRYTF